MSVFSSDPGAIGDYSAKTKTQPASMLNISFRTFMCRKCKQPKATAGRKSLGWKAGFKCADCCK